MKTDNFWSDKLVKEMLWKNTPTLTTYLEVEKLVDDFKKDKSSQSENYKILEFQRVSTGGIEWVWNDLSHSYVNTNSHCEGFFIEDLIGTKEDSKYKNTVRNGDIKIFTVERLSDGEIFSVGDRIQAGVIQSFRIDYNGNSLWVSTDEENDYGCAFSVAKKSTVFYLTEDGVQVKENTEMAALDEDAWEVFYPILFNSKVTDLKFFSTLKAAEAYKLLNRPQFSLNDIIKIKNESRCLGDTLLEELYKIAESKSNK